MKKPNHRDTHADVDHEASFSLYFLDLDEVGQLAGTLIVEAYSRVRPGVGRHAFFGFFFFPVA